MITVELDNFSLKEICQSGQCFRMRETEENTYELIAGDQYLKLIQEGTIVTFYCSDVEFLCYWVPYFDLDADYGGYIEKINPRDRYLCAAAASGSGIRILRQDLWEMIITFLISQQNNITRIRGCIDRLCKRYGEKKVSLDGMEYWSFPTPQQLGPLAGVGIELIKNLLHIVISGTQTAGVGEVANFLIGCAFIVPAGLIYHKKHTRTGALIGMASGTVLMTVIGGLMNAYVLLPVYAKAFGMPLNALVEMGTAINAKITSVSTLILFAVTPFNLLKGVLVSLIVFLIYKKISPIFRMK